MTEHERREAVRQMYGQRCGYCRVHETEAGAELICRCHRPHAQRALLGVLAHPQWALLLGVPLSEPVHETNDDGSDRVYIAQWFTHGRLDYHPELTGSPYFVEVGLVGQLDLQRRGWLPRA